MAGKSLNAKNLETLGAERLAELVMALVQGNAALKREARAALLETVGSEAMAAEVRKRLATLRRARSAITSKRRKDVLRDVTTQRDAIVERIGPSDPKTGFDLLWQFLELLPALYDRLYSGGDEFDAVFVEAMQSLGRFAGAAKIAPKVLADRVAAAITASNGFGLGPRLVDAVAEALGEEGRRALRAKLEKALNAGGHRTYGIRAALMALADYEGDADAWVALVPPEAARRADHAAGIAQRFLKADRAQDALAALDAVSSASSRDPDWIDSRLATLEALDRGEEAQTLRWRMFGATLAPRYLRDFMQRLPDFEDVEAEERGFDLAAGQKNVERALRFFIEWPALERASALVLAKRELWDGNMFHILTPAADALEAKYPLAATVLRRAMIEDTLSGGKSKRYKHAARHLLECESADAVIERYDPVPPHDQFVARLRDRHGRKWGFWELVAE